MNKNGHKPIIGIAGGIGSGKSTVAKEFGKYGCAVISADELNHQVLEQKEVIEQLVAWFSAEILDAEGGVDRKKLGEIVFDDAEKLARLTGLTHPRIAALQAGLVARYEADPGVKGIVLDVPLLFEVQQNELCDVVVFVDSAEKKRLERVKKRGWSEERLKKAENLQITLDMKVKMSDYIVTNNSCILDIAMQVQTIASALQLSQDTLH